MGTLLASSDACMPFLGWILPRLATRPRQRDWRHHRTR